MKKKKKRVFRPKTHAQGWSEFAKRKKSSPPRPLTRTSVKLFLKRLKQSRGENLRAIDLGCGPGSDSVFLLRKGFEVWAVDSNLTGLQVLRRRIPPAARQSLKLKRVAMQKFSFPRCSFVVASYSLPFLPRKELERVVKRVKKNLLPKGMFSAHFFGLKDGWAKSKEVSCLSRAELKRMLRGFKILQMKEVLERKRTVFGELKKWHVYEVIAQK